MKALATLTPGLDTDRLIVEHVMGGFCENPDKQVTGEDPGVWFWEHKRAKVNGKFTVLRGKSWSISLDGQLIWDHSWEAWSPSTEIKDAFDVINLLRSKSLLVITGNAMVRLNSFQCGVFFTHPGDTRESVTEYAETEPMAICRAAFEAMEVLKGRSHASF